MTLRGSTILAVDDDESILDLIQMTLEDEGYQVLKMADAALALDRLQQMTPALILLDMRMPGMNGWEFAEAYRENCAPRAPIVVMTAARDAAMKAAEIEAADYLGKPFDLEDLVAVVAKHVENHRPE